MCVYSLTRDICFFYTTAINSHCFGFMPMDLQGIPSHPWPPPERDCFRSFLQDFLDLSGAEGVCSCMEEASCAGRLDWVSILFLKSFVPFSQGILKVIGIVTRGSARFGRLMASARNGDIFPPADLRYLKGVPKKENSKNITSRAKIVSFLMGIYESVAETLPDIRDDTFDPDDFPDFDVQVPELMDPYAIALQTSADKEKQVNPKQKKVRKRAFSTLTLNTQRRSAHEIRFLPPGKMKDFYDQMKLAHPSADGEPAVAFSTFWKVWKEDMPFLKFRPVSNHAQCSTCVRHKLLIRAMNGHLKCRQNQVQQYVQHLNSQYQDRLVYWDLRGFARDKTPFQAVMILDGMDQGKFAYPRSDLFRSKSLAGFNRPRARIAGCICHGRLILFTVAAANLPKDANSCIETTAHVLHLLATQCRVDLRRMIISVQADNTSREVKNNHYIRFLASLVSHGILFLRSIKILFYFLQAQCQKDVACFFCDTKVAYYLCT